MKSIRLQHQISAPPNNVRHIGTFSFLRFTVVANLGNNDTTVFCTWKPHVPREADFREPAMQEAYQTFLAALTSLLSESGVWLVYPGAADHENELNERLRQILQFSIKAEEN